MQINTLCKTYVKNSAKEPGKAAEIRENFKIKIKENLSDHYHFESVCAETLGSWGSHGLDLIKMIGNKLKEATDEPRSTFFLFKQIAIKKETLSVFSEMDYFQAKKGILILKLYIHPNYSLYSNIIL